MTFAAELIGGFATRLTSIEAVDGKGTFSSAFTSMLGGIDNYNADFRTKGDTLGKEFIAGFGKNDKNGSATLFNSLFTTLLSAINNYEQQFFDKGKAIGNKFIEGFKNEQGIALINRHSEFVSSITGMITQVLAAIDEHSEDYRSKGESAGKAYAEGFNQGLENSGMSTLSPIVAMDANGQTATSAGITAILTSMGYATTTDIESLATRLDNIDNRFKSPIKVDDAHTQVLNDIKTSAAELSKLKDIKDEVSSLQKQVTNLKVYINKNILVGEIIDDIDKALGGAANTNVSGP